MAMIKSALELALEKTKDLKADPAALAAAEARQEGKKAAGRYLDAPAEVDPSALLSACPKERRRPFREGMHDILSSQLQLPTNDASLDKLETIGRGYLALVEGSGLLAGPQAAIAEKKIQALLQQLAGFFRQYLDDMKNVEKAIRTQWAPKLREKEREMASRLGQDVRLDPMMDQEFAAFYKQNVGAVRQQYQAALEKAKVELAALAGLGGD